MSGNAGGNQKGAGKKRDLDKNHRLMVTIPNRVHLYLRLVQRAFGFRSESEAIILLVNDFIETHREALERSPVGSTLAMFEERLAESERRKFSDVLDDYDFVGGTDAREDDAGDDGD
ncbi:MAG: hypothetical protein Kow0069_01510 [Promethearchaeota archaeon]